MGAAAAVSGPDFAEGVALGDVPASGVLKGRVGDEPALLILAGGEARIVGALCSHYGGDLSEGRLDADGRLWCPLHRACFSSRTGEALSAPAFAALPVWRAVVANGVVQARERRPAPVTAPAVRTRASPRRIVVVGGGAAGFAAAEMLRRRGYDGTLTMFSGETDPPSDRPNLSKDYLAGTAPDAWIPLREPSFYPDAGIDLRLAAEVARIEPRRDEIVSSQGERIGFDALLLATGCEPVRPKAPGFDQAQVFTLRSPADARAIVAAAGGGRRAVVVGAGFIGLEVAASLTARGLETHVVAPEAVPMARQLGPELGELIAQTHRLHDVTLRLGRSVSEISGPVVRLDDGSTIQADLVVLGVGVRPRAGLAVAAGFGEAGGVEVDAALRTRRPGVFAAGDVALWPDPLAGERRRVEHWVSAERQGQSAARAMLGERVAHAEVPFFWSIHHDLTIRVVGQADGGADRELSGSLADRNAVVRFRRNGRLIGAAAVGRDQELLAIAADLERALARD